MDKFMVWVISSTLPLLVIFILQFGIPSILKDKEEPCTTNIVFCYLIAFIFTVGFLITFMVYSPNLFCCFLVLLLLTPLLVHQVMASTKLIKSSLKVVNKKSSWDCSGCGTENPTNHITCWKCREEAPQTLQS